MRIRSLALPALTCLALVAATLQASPAVATTTPTVVRPESSHGWNLTEGSSDKAAFGVGPVPAPLGHGSVMLQVPTTAEVNANSGPSISKSVGVSTSSFGEITYEQYVPTGDAASPAAGVVAVAEIGDPSGNYAYAFSSAAGSVNAWSSVNTATAKWSVTCPDLSFFTGLSLTQVPSDCSLSDNVVFVGFEAGFDGTDNYAGQTVYMDDATVQGVTYDFEPTRLTAKNASIPLPSSGTKSMTFKLSIPKALPVAATVDWKTKSGTAKAGVDFVSGTGTVTIPAGSTTAKIVVKIKSDAHPDASETFKVVLSGPTFCWPAKASATGTIVG
jgi:hypothetical protein